MSKLVGRDREIQALRRTQRAASVGRLMLGELRSWGEFLEPETQDFGELTRSQLKDAKARFKSGISKEINRFCRQNFHSMTEAKLERLYLRVKVRRGLEMPLSQFQDEFAALNATSLSGAPIHCTVVISLWGLQTKFPEDILSKDIMEAVRQIKEAEFSLASFEAKSHAFVLGKRDEVQMAVRKQEFASRTCLLACFNLVEAALNGLAWDFSSEPERVAQLSNKKKALLEDGSFKEKLIKYPQIIAGEHLWNAEDDRVRWFLEEIKAYRDALVHASPFSRPDRYGGLDKLEHIYRIDAKMAQEAASRTARLLVDIFNHTRGPAKERPPWLTALEREVARSN